MSDQTEDYPALKGKWAARWNSRTYGEPIPHNGVVIVKWRSDTIPETIAALKLALAAVEESKQNDKDLSFSKLIEDLKG